MWSMHRSPIFNRIRSIVQCSHININLQPWCQAKDPIIARTNITALFLSRILRRNITVSNCGKWFHVRRMTLSVINENARLNRCLWRRILERVSGKREVSNCNKSTKPLYAMHPCYVIHNTGVGTKLILGGLKRSFSTTPQSDHYIGIWGSGIAVQHVSRWRSIF